MKHVVTAIALMAAGIACAVPAPYPVTVNSRAQTAPPVVVYGGNESVIRVAFTDGDTASVIGAGEIPFMAWATNATTGVNSTSSYEIVSGTTGTVDFTFSPSAVNFAPGRYIYEAGVKSSNGNNRVYRQGVFQIYGSPIGSGVASVNWSTNMNWATINWQNLPSGFEDGLSLTMWYAWLGTNTYVKTESDPNANARIDGLTNTITRASLAAAYAYSPTNPPPVTSVNGSTGDVIITAASLGALTNETDEAALAALAAHAAYWPLNATASSWFAFTTNSGAITITGYDIGGGQDVIIPDYINGWQVTTIGSSAFYENSIATISMPSVTTISESAFYYCTSLYSIFLPNVVTVDLAAFAGCVSLASVSLPKATTIGTSAFGACVFLSTVNIPIAEIIGQQAFDNCISIVSVSLPLATTFGSAAFAACSSLATVALPSATTFGTSVFGGCTAITSVTFSTDAPFDGGATYDQITANQVTNYVTNPQATGWGATFGGMPVVRLPLHADEIYQDGERVPSVAAIQGIVYSNAVSQMILWTNSFGACTNMARLEGGVWITNAFGAGEPLPEGVVTNGQQNVILDRLLIRYSENGAIISFANQDNTSVAASYNAVGNDFYLDSILGEIIFRTHYWNERMRLGMYGAMIMGNVVATGTNTAAAFVTTGTVSAASAILRDSGQPVSWEFSVSNGLFYASTNGVRAYKLTVEAP